jgi:hypothetical protein
MCIVVSPRLNRHILMAKNTCNNRKIVESVVFHTDRVISKENLWAYLCIPVSPLGNDSVNIFPRERRIVGGVDSYSVPGILKKIRRPFLTRTSCYSSKCPLRRHDDKLIYTFCQARCHWRSYTTWQSTCRVFYVWSHCRGVRSSFGIDFTNLNSVIQNGQNTVNIWGCDYVRDMDWIMDLFKQLWITKNK